MCSCPLGFSRPGFSRLAHPLAHLSSMQLRTVGTRRDRIGAGSRRALTLALSILVLMVPATTSAAEDRASPFRALAARKKLAASLEWRRLLHYHSRLLSGAASEVDGQAFFLSSAGATDASAELDQTLRAFFLPVVKGHENRHALCRFPARFAFLDRQLGLRSALGQPTCPALGRFLRRVDPRSVSLVYAANALENPVSAFGHTFLYLRSQGAREADLALEFHPDTDTKNPLLYAFKGLTGLFDGRFRTQPARAHFHDYAVLQDRDLWIFDLDLRPPELELLRLHIWELAATHVDYFYLTQNCSYHVVGALEAAAPRLPLTAHTKFAVLPMDTVKALFVTPGLVKRVHHVPSRSSRYIAEHQRLDSGRSPRPRIPWAQSPERGHGTMRFDLGTGATTLGSSGFVSAGYRLALHDLADPTDGHPNLAQVQFLDTRLRFTLAPHRLSLDHLTFAELISLHSLTSPLAAASWRVAAYGERSYDRRCPGNDCFAHGVNGSLGATLTAWGDSLAVYLMADSFVRFSGELDGIGGSFVSAGLGPYGGLRIRFSNLAVAWLSGSWSYLPAADLKQTYDFRGKLRGALSQNVALGVESRLAPEAFQAEFVSYLYF